MFQRVPTAYFRFSSQRVARFSSTYCHWCPQISFRSAAGFQVFIVRFREMIVKAFGVPIIKSRGIVKESSRIT